MANKLGRPTKFSEKIITRILFLAAKGLIEDEIAEVLDISPSTLDKWKKSPSFLRSMNAAKNTVDDQVRSALLSRALGYDYEEEYPTKDGAVSCEKKMHPDVAACKFWLMNRKAKDWREKGADGEGEDHSKTLIQIFNGVRSKEAKRIEAGEDPMDVLFSPRFTAFMEAKKVNGNTDSAPTSE